MSWQPIATAPKDGTRVLLAPHGMVAHWEFGDDNWQFFQVPLTEDMKVSYNWRERAALYFCVSDGVYGVGPTHWHPLPTPPEAQ